MKIDMVLRKETAHSRAEFERRRRLQLWPGFEASVASPEDVIIKKLQYFQLGGSEKHLRDIRGILAETAVDHDYLERWIKDLGLERAWLQAKA